MRAGAAEIAIERQAARLRRRLGRRQRHAEDGVGAEAGFVARAVELDHRRVDAALVLGIHAGKRVEDLGVDRIDGLLDALAEVAPLIAIAQLDRLMRTGRGARRNRRAAHGAILQHHVDLDRRVAAAVENFAADDVDNGGHGRYLMSCRPWMGVGGSGAF